MNKMWDGRFAKATDELMERFNNSLPIDKVMINEDIIGSIAWAKALEREGVLTIDECKKIEIALNEIRDEYNTGNSSFNSSDEDIHMAVERLLTEKTGDIGKKIHTGRSRNDQVATDFRLFVMNRMRTILTLINNLQSAILFRATEGEDVIIPSFTHLQQAQPVSLAHYWLSFFYLLEREKKRFKNAIESADYMPLGSGAVAGCGFAIDRNALAKDIGFSRITDNSMDGVAARDFVLEALSAISSIGISCSRYAEDMIIWSSKEFGFIELDDAWSTGSSMMPQKKNPDSLELIRGKSGRFIGNQTRFSATLKGVGLTYFKDLQEDKEPFIDSADNIELVLEVFASVIATLSVNKENIKNDLDPSLLATDLADYLVRKGMPFRDAHDVVGKTVGYCIDNKEDLTKLSLKKLKEFSNIIEEDVAKIFNWKTALNHRDVAGGTGPNSVKAQIKKAKDILEIRE